MGREIIGNYSGMLLHRQKKYGCDHHQLCALTTLQHTGTSDHPLASSELYTHTHYQVLVVVVVLGTPSSTS
jgi:hypothetical protein